MHGMIIALACGAIGSAVGGGGCQFTRNFYSNPQFDAVAALWGVIGAVLGIVGGRFLGLRLVVVLLGGTVGVAVGFFGALAARVIYDRWRYPGFDLGFDYAAGLFGMGGALLGLIGGVLSGVWLAGRPLFSK
jgi:hypothetical protein